MYKLFPARSDDLLDVASLPPTDNTELNYRTQPLTGVQELRLTLLIMIVALPVMLALSVAAHFFYSAIPLLGDVVISLGVTYGAWLVIRKLTGALQRPEALAGYVLLAGSMGGVIWELVSQLNQWSFEIGIAAAWFTSCMIARQAAAWILVGPTVDHETMRRWDVNLPTIVPRGWSLDCPELLTFNVGLVLVGSAWGVSLAILSWTNAGSLFWPISFAVSAHLVWLAWHLLVSPLVPCPDPGAGWMATCRAVKVFATYDIYNTPAAGVFRFPTKRLRNSWRRWGLLAVTLAAIGFGFGVHLPNPFITWRDGGSFAAQVMGNLMFVCAAGPVVLYCTLWLVAGTLLARFEQELSYHRDPDRTDWDNYIDRMINSADELERKHLFVGTSETSDYPVLVHREIHDQHGHILGGSGASKTAFATIGTSFSPSAHENTPAWSGSHSAVGTRNTLDDRFP